MRDLQTTLSNYRFTECKDCVHSDLCDERILNNKKVLCVELSLQLDKLLKE